MIFTIEFNIKQQHFHLNRGQHEPNTFGWQTIAEDVDDTKASIFCNSVDELLLKNRLTVSQVKDLWLFYEIVANRFEGWKLLKWEREDY